jgi:hypothetical protein
VGTGSREEKRVKIRIQSFGFDSITTEGLAEPKVSKAQKDRFG